LVFAPQQNAAPELVRAHAPLPLTDMDENVPAPGTAVGVKVPAFQQYAPPTVVSPQAWFVPLVLLPPTPIVMNVSPPVRAVGVAEPTPAAPQQ
jgi:hypothetical protein